jgi:hypothetical protein
MGRERFLLLPFAPPCGSAVWDPDLSGRKSWRYSPESPTCVEGEFSEVRALPLCSEALTASEHRLFACTVVCCLRCVAI